MTLNDQDKELNELEDKNEEIKNEIENLQEDEELKEEKEFWLIDPDKLIPHKKNETIYGREEVDEDLVDSIRANGQLEPIIINQKDEILSGHRRWRALKKIKQEDVNIKAICFRNEYENETQETEAIIEFNRYREKTPMQIYKESKELFNIFTQQADKRRKSNLRNLPKYVEELNSVHREDKPGRSLEKLAEAVHMKRDRLAKIIWIGKRYEKGDTDAIDVMKCMERGVLSVDAAYKLLKLIDVSNSNQPEADEARKLVKRAKEGNVTSNKAVKLLDKYKEKKDKEENTNGEKNKENIDTQLTDVINSGEEFNVIVADPDDIDKARKRQITRSMDAVLFLWATTENMKDRMDLMEMWGFKLKKIGIWDTGKTSGNWFRGTVEFLLFGIKGNWEKPTFRPEIILSKDKETDKNKYDYVYDMVEKMFPGQKYIDPFSANKRKDWGQPYIINLNDSLENDDKKVIKESPIDSIPLNESDKLT